MNDYDARLVDLYDADNPDGPDHDFYRTLADEVAAGAVLDLGCGTGILTVTLAAEGRTVVGVDPSAAMLVHARGRTGAGAVEWIQGDSQSIPDRRFDLALMTGNVAQHIDDAAWARTLDDLHRALRPGDTLAFESRNPAARAWESWGSGERTTRDSAHGPLTEWMEVEPPDEASGAPGDSVRIDFRTVFEATGEIVTETEVLAFRDRVLLTAQLEAAGFEVEAMYGDWERGPLTAESRVIVTVARAG